MKHLNDNLLCAVTAFLTGPDYQRDDIIQICITPLDKFYEVHSEIVPFFADMKMRRKNIDKNWLGHDFGKIEAIETRGIDPYYVADALEVWFERYRVREHKLIMPLAYNWVLIRGFLIDWLGFETFNNIFDYRYRDIMPASIYCNDRAYWHSEDYPYPKHDFVYLCNVCNVDYVKANDTMQQSMAVAKCYKSMMKVYVSI